MSRVAIYARYSSEQQRDASIEDQVRLCKERVSREGWKLSGVYTDHGVSGASLMRPGIQQLMQDALSGKFDIIIAEALDRLSRDQEDIAGVFKRLRFASVSLLTLSEGEIGDLHIGLKGTMNALFLKDLADKTRRGLRGRVEAGKSGGGNSYGYNVVNAMAADGTALRGGRNINAQQAAIVRRIFNEYADGKSPKAIVKQFNKERIPGPSGKGWGPTTVYGNRDRGTGILNNELYIGRLVWNRLRYVKDPDTGKRISRANPEAAIIVKDVPELRIIEQPLWDRVKARQGALAEKLRGKDGAGIWALRRPRYLFSGLMKCGCCGGGFVKISKDHFGCAAARDKGTCTNLTAIHRERLEATVLGGLQDRLMDPALLDIFCAEYARHINRLRMERTAESAGRKAELAKITKDIDRCIDSIIGGVPPAQVKDRMIALDARKTELESLIGSESAPQPVLLHPKMSERYRTQVAELREALNDDDRRSEAGEIIRSLIEKIVLSPVGIGKARSLVIDLHGQLAGILTLGAAAKKTGADSARVFDQQIKMVAGAGFEPTTFRL